MELKIKFEPNELASSFLRKQGLFLARPLICCTLNPVTGRFAGDQVMNLLWRLQNGELPLQKQPKVAVVLIGTNDLGAAATCGDSAITAAADAAAYR